MNRSSSRTSQRQDTTTVSNQLGIEDVDGPVLVGDGSLTVTTVDTGAVEAAFDFADDVAGDSLDFAGDTVDNAFDFGSDALDASLQGVDRSFDFAGEALDLVDEAQQLAIESANESRRDALSFAAGTVKNSQKLIDDSQARAFSFADGAFESALAGIEDASDTALDTVAGFSLRAVDSIVDSQQDAIDAVANATQSDAAKSIDKITIIAGLALVSFAAVLLFKG